MSMASFILFWKSISMMIDYSKFSFGSKFFYYLACLTVGSTRNTTTFS